MSFDARKPRHRSFAVKSMVLAAIVGSHWIALATEAETRQATGVKVGGVTDTSAIVWTRLTASNIRNNEGVVIKAKVDPSNLKVVSVPVTELEGACPGAPGQVRVRYGTREDLSGARSTKWAKVSAATDFTHQFRLARLKPDTVYHYAVETTGPGGSPDHGALRGHFRTALRSRQPTELMFCVVTCFMYHTVDHPEGYNVFHAMTKLDPRFVVFTGDNVYYDNVEPRAVNSALAHYHWERTFSFPRAIELLRRVPTYWEKDDHDTLRDDAWPGLTLGNLTYAEGQRIFREQVPMGDNIYRTFRWGRDLQIWLTDGRDFRSPNPAPDGPDKTIWGREQKDWLKRTLKRSDATWKILISPTPIVGPDRSSKRDNHANKAFRHEGDEIRAWFQANVPDNFFVVCGDRHWQYHSVHPQTGLNEFSVGSASDGAASGTPGENDEYHRFHRVNGGFLSVTLRRDGNRSTILLQHRDVFGNVGYEWTKQAVVAK